VLQWKHFKLHFAPYLVSGFITVQSFFFYFWLPHFDSSKGRLLFKTVIQIILMFYYVTECSRNTTFRWYLLEFEGDVNERCLCYQSDICDCELLLLTKVLLNHVCLLVGEWVHLCVCVGWCVWLWSISWFKSSVVVLNPGLWLMIVLSGSVVYSPGLLRENIQELYHRLQEPWASLDTLW